jgi:hypothetical protein
VALLPNDTGVLRLNLDLVGRETGPRAPGAGAEAPPAAPTRVLASVTLESRDARDGEWWPLVRLPVVYVAAGGVQELVAGLLEVLQGAVPGIAWSSGDDGALGLQLGAPEGGTGLLLAEVGIDLGLFLAESAGTPRRAGAELALFRWPVRRADAVSFADALRRESDGLPAAG